MKKALLYLSLFAIVGIYITCAKDDPETPQTSKFVFVSCVDAESISVIDASDFGNVTQISGEAIGALTNEPRNLDVSSDGNLVYVPCRHSDNVLVIDGNTRSVTHNITDAGFDEPYALAFTPDNKQVWVVNKKGGGSSTGSITVINTTSRAVVSTINDVNLSSPEGICFAAGKAYIANRGDGTVSVFDVSTQNFITNIDVGGEPRFTVSSVNGDFVYVTGTSGDLTKLRTDLNTIAAEIPAYGRNAAISPDGSKLYVGSQGSTIHVVNLANDQVTDITIADASSIYAVTILSDGTMGFATDEENDVVFAFDPSTGTLLNGDVGIPVKEYPRAIASQ